MGTNIFSSPHKIVRRNDPCPCGSGKKDKYCHGSPEWQESMKCGTRVAMARAEAQRVQHKRQQVQGSGRVWLDVNDDLSAAIPTTVRKLLEKIIQG